MPKMWIWSSVANSLPVDVFIWLVVENVVNPFCRKL